MEKNQDLSTIASSVSVVQPTVNRGRLLIEALNSVVQQPYRLIEILFALAVCRMMQRPASMKEFSIKSSEGSACKQVRGLGAKGRVRSLSRHTRLALFAVYANLLRRMKFWPVTGGC